MKLFEHFKKKTIYRLIAESIPHSKATLPELCTIKLVKHHDTQKYLEFIYADGQYKSPTEEPYVIYTPHEGDGEEWAREYDDFYGYKKMEDGTQVRRFLPLANDIQFKDEQKYERPQADIKVPDNYLTLLQSTIKDYKKWHKENEKLQVLADEADTDEDREAAKKQATDHFKTRYAGFLAKDTGDRLSVSQLNRIWDKFIRDEYRGFLHAHVNITMEQIVSIGIDKFIYVLGWKRPSDVASWHNNKLRIGVCCHCQDQFLPMMLQFNHGLCANCRPHYSAAAIRNFVIRQLNTSERYEKAHHDCLMDFYIMFYHDEKFRSLFIEGTPTAEEWSQWREEVPEWAKPRQNPTNEVEQ